MIAPSNYRPGMSYDDALAGYLADGESADDAEALAIVLTTHGGAYGPQM